MLTSIRLTPSITSSSFNTAFDLAIEGLNEMEARSVSELGQDLMLGIPAALVAPVDLNSRNPLAKRDESSQKAGAIVIRLFQRRFDDKISSIKLLREMYPGLGLGEAMDFVDFAVECTVTDARELKFPSYYNRLRPDWMKF
jgi:ribosomal protein L7/L12